MDQDGPVDDLLVVTAPACDGPIYFPAFVLRPSAKADRPSRKRTVPTMASVLTSTTAFARQ